MKIFICSPYSGDIKNNVEFAKKICRKVIAANQNAPHNNIPYAPHLYFTQFMDDGVAEERGIMYGLDMLSSCDIVLAVCKDGNISSGMRKEISFADSIDKPIALFDNYDSIDLNSLNNPCVAYAYTCLYFYKQGDLSWAGRYWSKIYTAEGSKTTKFSRIAEANSLFTDEQVYAITDYLKEKYYNSYGSFTELKVKEADDILSRILEVRDGIQKSAKALKSIEEDLEAYRQSVFNYDKNHCVRDAHTDCEIAYNKILYDADDNLDNAYDNLYLFKEGLEG